MGASRIISLHTILELPGHFLAYYMEPLRSVSSHTIWGAPLKSLSLFTICPPPPQISFFACYRGATSDLIFFTKYMPPPRSVSPLTIWGPPQVSFFVYYMGPPQISFCAYFLGAPPRSVFSLTIWGPLRSVFSHTIWGAPQISFFAYYMGVP